ncbi:aldehyde dehydrogenase family protein [Saccharopolyspora sp. HNM0983]|uniref:Aldehyde dehydrogenase family protein n=1 Tax=Saccharopolyspora montiporae TaxID=2781240 RepID=A0A929BAC0_9PSEU|nr:aldehyde dehydrogenase family protein [Saccharopolyspora sp. HNM0983]MBE9375151.1 aldehyde dehydrogenase family protein [Saccharopolyspora sp. HNM0983]
MTETAPWDDVPAPESRATAALRAEYGMFVDGEFRAGGGEPRTGTDPATEQPLATVATADESDVDTAIRAARRAQRETWGRLPGTERAKHLFRIARLVQEHSRELAVLQTLDTGRTIRSSKEAELPAAAAQLFHHAGWADKLPHAGFGPDPRPVGVAAQIAPADASLLALVRMLAPALACGNTAVLKPAAASPLGALVLAEICRTAGLPAGVVNVLPGPAEVGGALAGHPDVAAVALTGSAAAGESVRTRLAGNGTRLALEPRTADADIVFDDAPLDQAVDGVLDGITGLRGRGARILLQESVAERFLDLLRERVRGLRLGDPLDANTDVGPLTSAGRLARNVELTAHAQELGAERWTAELPLPERGHFAEPAVLTGATQAMPIARADIPGPVLPVLTFRTPEEALAKANNTARPPAVSVWSHNGSTALWAAQHLRASAVRVNGAERPDVDPAGLETYLDV